MNPWRLHTAVLTLAALGLAGCTAGAGEGWVRSDRLFVEDCWNGPFDLGPTFFGANPYRQQELLIRVQREDNLEDVSDGLVVLVNDVGSIRAQDIGQPVAVALPPEIRVAPTGAPPPGAAQGLPQVSLSLYLHATCHAQNGTVYATSGSITFASLFSGDPNESNGADRLTDATFDATFADPRDMAADGSVDPAKASQVQGHFRFYFQRGQPAQPFP